MHPRVLVAVQDERGSAALAGVIDRAAIQEHLPVVPGALAGMYQVFLVGNIGSAHLGDLVADPHEHDAGREVLGQVGRPPCRCIAAVGAAGDGHLVAIHQPDVHQVVHRVHEIIELLAGGIGLAQLGELHAAPRAAAVVGIVDDVALGGGHLPQARVTRQPAVAEVGLRTAVHYQEHRVTHALHRAPGAHKHAFQLQAVPGLVAHHLLGRQHHLAEPGVAVRATHRLTLRPPQQEHLRRMAGAITQERQCLSVPGDRQLREHGPARTHHRAPAGAVVVHLAQRRPHPLIAQVEDSVGVAPAHPAHMPFVAGQQLTQLAPGGVAHRQSAGGRVMGVHRRDRRQARTVRAPCQGSQLAHAVQLPYHRAGVGIDDMNPAVVVAVIHQRRGRQRQGQPRSHRTPVQRRRGSGKIQCAVLSVGIAERGDPHLHRTPVLAKNLLVESLILQLLQVVGDLLLGQERHARSVGTPGVTADVRVVLHHAARLAAAHGKDMKRLVLVAVPLGEKRDGLPVGGPGDGADVLLPHHVRPRVAGGADHVQLRPGRAVLLIRKRARHAQHIRHLLAIGRDGNLPDRTQLRHVMRCESFVSGRRDGDRDDSRDQGGHQDPLGVEVSQDSHGHRTPLDESDSGEARCRQTGRDLYPPAATFGTSMAKRIRPVATTWSPT